MSRILSDPPVCPLQVSAPTRSATDRSPPAEASTSPPVRGEVSKPPLSCPVLLGGGQVACSHRIRLSRSSGAQQRVDTEAALASAASVSGRCHVDRRLRCIAALVSRGLVSRLLALWARRTSTSVRSGRFVRCPRRDRWSGGSAGRVFRRSAPVAAASKPGHIAERPRSGRCPARRRLCCIGAFVSRGLVSRLLALWARRTSTSVRSGRFVRCPRRGRRPSGGSVGRIFRRSAPVAAVSKPGHFAERPRSGRCPARRRLCCIGALVSRGLVSRLLAPAGSSHLNQRAERGHFAGRPRSGL